MHAKKDLSTSQAFTVFLLLNWPYFYLKEDLPDTIKEYLKKTDNEVRNLQLQKL